MKKSTKSVSFRLSEDVLQLLKERADSVKLSHGEMARSMVIASLCGSPSDQPSLTVEHLEMIQKELSMHAGRTDKKLAYLLYVILTQVGKLDPSQAKQIVKEQFLRRLEELP